MMTREHEGDDIEIKYKEILIDAINRDDEHLVAAIALASFHHCNHKDAFSQFTEEDCEAWKEAGTSGEPIIEGTALSIFRATEHVKGSEVANAAALCILDDHEKEDIEREAMEWLVEKTFGY